MFIQFSYDEKVQRAIDLPTEQRFPLVQGIPLLEAMNSELVATNKTGTIDYHLFYDNQEEIPLLQASLTLPIEDKTMLEAIQAPFLTSEELSEEERDYLLNLFGTKKGKIKKEKKSKVEKIPKPKKEKKERQPFFFLQGKGKFILISIISLLSVSVLVIGGLSLAKNPKAPPSLETLLHEEKYIEAGKEYPKETSTIENELFSLVRTKDKSYLEQLKQFNKQYPTLQGNFDLAMFDYDYQKALSFYTKNSSDFEQDNERLALVGYAYLKVNKIDDAKKLLKKCNDAELEKLILQYEQAQKIINEKQQEIEELQKKPTENKKKIEQAIEELYQAKEKLNLI